MKNPLPEIASQHFTSKFILMQPQNANNSEPHREAARVGIELK
jgi:hypothetical protein